MGKRGICEILWFKKETKRCLIGTVGPKYGSGCKILGIRGLKWV